jgi:hypothetical protein
MRSQVLVREAKCMEGRLMSEERLIVSLIKNTISEWIEKKWTTYKKKERHEESL